MMPQPTGAFEWVQAASAPALVCGPLLAVAPHLYTTADWILGDRSADPALAWAEIGRAIGVRSSQIVRVRQVHGAAVRIVKAPDRVALDPPDADVIATDRADLAVAVQAADCAPILIADRARGVVAAAHAGWRGLAARVPAAAVSALAAEWHSRPEDLVASVGPSIGPCCYEIGDDVRRAFEAAAFTPRQLSDWFGAESPNGRTCFDVWGSARDQLAGAGVPARQIHLCGVCTGCWPARFCSFRRSGTAAGRMAAVIRPAPAVARQQVR